MRSSLLSVCLVALMVVEAGCASDSDGSTGTGGASGSGGASSAGGSTSSGGLGGDAITGGAAGSGGAQESGGAPTGGSTGTGGASGSGGTGGGMTGGTGGGATGGGGGSATGGTGGSTTGGTGGSATGGTGGGATGGDSAGGSAGGEPPAGGQATGGSTGGASAGDGGAPGGQGMRARQIEARGFTFDALEIGPADGEPVLLLHGFPDISLMWTNLMTVLAENGYHCLAPDQRGYSPGARPTEVNAYRYEELIADSFAFGAELGDRYHLIAHDWGANIAWLMLEADPTPIASFTPMAIPHYRVWARAALEDDDMAVYRSLLNTWMTPGDGEAAWTPQSMKNMWSAKPADQTEQTIAHMMEEGAMTAALNWYRASDGHRSVLEDFDDWKVDVPTLLIFGTDDMGQGTVTDTAPLMTGPYRVVQPDGSHFIVDEQPRVVAEETLAHLRAHPITQ
ncbi:MAG: alpha/beta fold hydrolase [Polyangiaceae bacterium]|nr:alpha/beta fold hydrolase [Polyangiaceae bacterium]